MINAIATTILVATMLAVVAGVLAIIWAAEGVVGVVSAGWIAAVIWAVFVLDRTEGSWEP